MFKSFNINGWRQLEKIDIEFHDRMTILTGANGSGKTTILKILSRHFGWQSHFVATLKEDKTSGLIKYFANIWEKLVGSNQTNPNIKIIGQINYKNGTMSSITLPTEVSNLYDVDILNMQSIQGLYIPSHRPVYKYAKVETIPTRPQTRKEVYNAYRSAIQSDYIDQYYGGKKPTYIIKEMLISLATFGYGNKVVIPNKDALSTFEEFQDILKIVLPTKLGFEKFVIQMPEVLLKTKTGTFPIDAVSGGIAAIIDLSWQIFMYGGGDKFVVIIDEPENHLHPQIQRTLLPNFIKAFPNVQFIVVTHNPFIISSVPDSNVYVLDYNNNDAVITTKLDLVNRAGSSNDILREVLGVPFTMPIWVEEKLDNIIEKFSKLEINDENFNSLREEMENIGLEKLFPDTIVKVVEKGEIND